MSLPEFICGHHEDIIREFAAFAKTLMPPGAQMTEAELRDHAQELLTAIADDMHLRQTSEEEHRKSQGRGSAHSMEASGRLHAVDRIVHGYPFQAVLAEFRALRASVLRLYEKSGATDLTEVRRFNEAIDEGLMASMHEFARETALVREREAFFLKLSDALRPLDDPAQVKATATRLLGKQLRVNRVFYADAEDGYWIVTKGYETGVDPLPDQPFAMSEYGDWIIEGFREGKRLVVSDMHADGRFQDAQRNAHLALQIGAEVAVPLVKAGELVAMLISHNDSPRDWSEQDIALIEEVAERTWAAVERARAKAALRASEEKYRSLFASIDEGFCTLEVLFDAAGEANDWRYLEANEAYARQTGQQDPSGRLGSALTPNAEASWLATFASILRTGAPQRFEQFHHDTGRWYSLYMSRVGGDESRQIATVFNDISERKEREERQAFLLKLSDDFRERPDEQSVGLTCVEALARHMQVDRCYITEMSAELNRGLVAPGIPATRPQAGIRSSFL